MTGAKKFRFVSPGVQIREIDKSQLPSVPEGVGPVVIGRMQRGPGMVPVKVNNYLEFVETFGSPIRGGGSADVWRDGNTTSPTYAAYAAQAYLKNAAPLTVVRLLGTQNASPSTTGYEQAGWKTENVAASQTLSTNGGAYGLFVIPSSSTPTQNVTGTLAAVFYLEKGAIRLAGTDMVGNSVGSNGGAVFVRNVGSSYEFQAVVENDTGATVLNTTFNFNQNSSKYIRKVFNTNPTLVNDDITPSESLKTYWLGETYESNLKSIVSENSGNVAGKVYGAIVALENSTISAADFKGVDSQPAQTGWVISQHLSNTTSSFNPEDMTKLFRLVVNQGDGSGEWEQNNVKVSVLDIKPSVSEYNRYGTFTVGVRKLDDTDSNPQFLEVFTNLTLDPQSKDYVAARIGDKYITWDETQKRHITLGSHDNASNYLRVEMNPIAEQGGLEPELLPFGFFGPPRFTRISLTSGSAVSATSLMKGTGSIPYVSHAGGGTVVFGPSVLGAGGAAASLLFPSLRLRVSSSEAGTLRDSNTYFGVTTAKVNSSKLDEDYKDLVRAKPDGVNSYIKDSNTEYSFVFTLDDVVAVSGSSVSSYWLSGSRATGVSVTAQGASILTGSTDGYKNVLTRGHDRFTMPLFGGTDGLDITEREPFRNTYLSKGGGTDRGNYAVHSLTRALDTILDPETLDMNVLTIPGVTNNTVTRKVIDVCESRADSLAIIDLDGGYQPETESDDVESLRLGSVDTVITNLKARALNSSYACAYYPWVKIRESEGGFPLWVPPSVVALGTLAYSEKNTEVWFAPAGFNRGGLTNGSSGLDVIDVREKLSSKQRDKLYEVNINPIASFPSEGIVVFGQKTLQVTRSALDRINVRRLVLFLKKEISKISSRLLFDPNVDTTWSRFTSQVKPMLERVQTGFGITDFKLVLDKTTTTPEEIDRNMMYAKIFIKPAYAIEYIGVDFIVTNTGASFEDL